MSKANKGFVESEDAISPAIASLVLIVVAVVAAAGVGVLTSSMTDTTEGTMGETTGRVSNQIDVQGSTTVLPFAVEAAKEYMKDNAVEISVAGGGSGHGRSMAKEDKIDIGMASSRAATADIIQEGEEGAVLYETEVGKRMIVVIANDGGIGAGNVWQVTDNSVASSIAAGGRSINISDLVAAYNDGNSTYDIDSTTFTLYQRGDVSGTEEGFAKYLGLGTGDNDQLPAGATEVSGNAGVWNAVTSTTDSIGFVDLGFITDNEYACNQNDVGVGNIVPSADNYDDYTDASKAISLSSTTTADKPLTSKLYFYTNGVPSGVTEEFIAFCISTLTDEGQDILQDVGMIEL